MKPVEKTSPQGVRLVQAPARLCLFPLPPPHPPKPSLQGLPCMTDDLPCLSCFGRPLGAASGSGAHPTESSWAKGSNSAPNTSLHWVRKRLQLHAPLRKAHTGLACNFSPDDGPLTPGCYAVSKRRDSKQAPRTNKYRITMAFSSKHFLFLGSFYFHPSYLKARATRQTDAGSLDGWSWVGHWTSGIPNTEDTNHSQTILA